MDFRHYSVKAKSNGLIKCMLCYMRFYARIWGISAHGIAKKFSKNRDYFGSEGAIQVKMLITSILYSKKIIAFLPAIFGLPALPGG